MHKHENDIRCLHEGQNHKRPLDHAPGERLCSFEVDSHEDFCSGQEGQDGGYLPNVFSNGSALFLAVVSIQCVAVVHYEIVAFHVFRIRRLSVRSAESDEVKECKYEDPNEVNEVPVETNFLHHFIVLSAFEYAAVGHEENDDVDDYTREYVETVKTRDEEKEVCIRLLDGIFVVMHVCAERKGFRARIPQFHRFIAAYVRFIFDVFVNGERVELGFMRVFSVLHKLDAVVAVLQCYQWVALEPRLSEVAEVMVHVDSIPFVQVERLAIVGGDRSRFLRAGKCLRCRG